MQHPELNQVFDIEAHSDDVDDLDVCPQRKLVMSNSLLPKYLLIYFFKDRIHGFVIVELAIRKLFCVRK